MADVLIYFDESGYIRDKDTYNRIGSILQGIISNYNALGFGNLVDSELVQLFNNPIEFIFDKMTGGEQVSIAGVEVHKEKAIDILKKPIGYEALIAQLNEFKLKGVGVELSITPRRVTGSTIAGIYTIDLNGDIVLKASFDAQLKEQYKKYAKTERAKKMLEFAQSIIDKADELEITDLLKRNPNGPWHTIKHIVNGGDGKDIALNVDGIMIYNNINVIQP